MTFDYASITLSAGESGRESGKQHEESESQTAFFQHCLASA
jgi:hypothetical protein